MNLPIVSNKLKIKVNISGYQALLLGTSFMNIILVSLVVPGNTINVIKKTQKRASKKVQACLKLFTSMMKKVLSGLTLGLVIG